MAADIRGWISSNLGNIIAGIVASFIVLALQVVVRALSLALAEYISLKHRLKLIYRLRKPRRICVVSGAVSGVSEQVKAAILAGPDAEAASMLIATAGLLYPEAELRHVYSSIFPPDFYKEHLVVVGGPVNNSCTAAVMHHLQGEVEFSEEFELCLANGNKFATEYDERSQACKDYGAVVRLANPFDGTKDVVLVVGCDTYGVLGAASLLSCRREYRSLQRQLLRKLGLRKYFSPQSYIAIVECDVLGTDIGDVRLKEVILRHVT